MMRWRTMARTRKTGPFNSPFLLLSGLVNGNSCEIIELDGHLDHEMLKRALAAAIARHPLLQSRLERTMTGGRWVRDQQDAPPDLRIARLATSDPEATRKRLVANIWDEPLDLTAGRPARFHLTETPDGSILQLVTHHISSDARSGYRFAHDIANAYTALSEGRMPDTTVIDCPEPPDAMALEGQDRSTGALVARALSMIGRDLFSRAKGQLFPRRRGGSDIGKIDLGGERLAAVKRAAKRRGVTVHALLLAATVRACQAHDRARGRNDRRVYPLLDMVSLRPYAGGRADDLYDTMVVPVGIRLDGRLDDESLIRAAAAEIRRLKSGDVFAELWRQKLYGWSAAPLPKNFATRLVLAFLIKGNIICSNPGPIPYEIERFGPVAVRDFWSFSQLFPPGRVTFTFSTYRDRLRMIMVHDPVAFPDGEIEDFARTLISALDSYTVPHHEGQGVDEGTTDRALLGGISR